MNLTQNPFIKFLNLEIPLGSTIVITPRSILIILFAFFITWLVLKTFKKIEGKNELLDSLKKLERLKTTFGLYDNRRHGRSR